MSEKAYSEIAKAYPLRGRGRFPRNGIYLVEVKECLIHDAGGPSLDVIWGLQILAPARKRATMGINYNLTRLYFFEELQEAFAVFGIRFYHMVQAEEACKRVIGMRAFIELRAKRDPLFFQKAKLRRPKKPCWERMTRYEAGTYMNIVGLGFHDYTLDSYKFAKDKEDSDWAA